MSSPLELMATALATLLVSIGPIETAAVFGMLTAGRRRPERFRLARRAVAIAGIVLIGFALGGVRVLSLLHVSLPAFRVAGGVLLLLQAVSLCFGSPKSLSALTVSEEREAERPGDIAVFPLAFPLIAGPGALTAVVLLMGRADGSVAAGLVVIGALLVSLALTLLALLNVETTTRLLGVTGADVVGRLSGVLLAALAIQFIFDGIHDEF